MNVRLYDGTVRCADHFDSSTYESETSDPCAYCDRSPDAYQGPDAASPSDGWVVRHVSSGTHKPSCPHLYVQGTYALTHTDVESFNGVLKIIGEFADLYGYRPRSTSIGTGSFRWTFEREYADGHRGADMILVSKIG